MSRWPGVVQEQAQETRLYPKARQDLPTNPPTAEKTEKPAQPAQILTELTKQSRNKYLWMSAFYLLFLTYWQTFDNTFDKLKYALSPKAAEINRVFSISMLWQSWFYFFTSNIFLNK